jgi:predicted RNA-binding protein with PUA-like domain
MAFWLLKTEPSEYSFARLLADRKTRWGGVTNNLALKHLRAMAVGDQAVIYHTGDEKAVVGTARVVKAAYPDPDADDERVVAVDLEAGTVLPAPVTLATFRADPILSTAAVVRMPRLSVVPLTAEQWRRLVPR